jgi:hypothetical protein
VLSGEQRRILREAFVKVFTLDELEMFVVEDLGEDAAALFANRGIDTEIHHLFEYLHRKYGGACWTLILEKAISVRASNSAFVTVCRAMLEVVRVGSPRPATAPPANPGPSPAGGGTSSPKDAVWLDNGLPFFDRDKFRKKLDVLLAQGQPRIMVVRGPRQSGKSYSLHLLIHYYQAHLISELPWSVRVDPTEAARLTVRQFALRLGARLGLDRAEFPDDDPNQSIEQWISLFVNWFAGRVARQRIRGIIVLDGLDEPGIDVDIHSLVHEVANEISKNQPDLRLIFLGYDQSIKGIAKQALIDDQVDWASYPTDDDLRTYCMRLARQFPALAPPVAGDVEGLIAQTSAYPLGMAERLKFVNTLFGQFTRLLLNTA